MNTGLRVCGAACLIVLGRDYTVGDQAGLSGLQVADTALALPPSQKHSLLCHNKPLAAQEAHPLPRSKWFHLNTPASTFERRVSASILNPFWKLPFLVWSQAPGNVRVQEWTTNKSSSCERLKITASVQGLFSQLLTWFLFLFTVEASSVLLTKTVMKIRSQNGRLATSERVPAVTPRTYVHTGTWVAKKSTVFFPLSIFFFFMFLWSYCVNLHTELAATVHTCQ